jgi:hypothetical protein
MCMELDRRPSRWTTKREGVEQESEGAQPRRVDWGKGALCPSTRSNSADGGIRF